MLSLRWIKIKGHKIEDIFASYDYTTDSFKVENFFGENGTYIVSGDLPSSFPNPATVFYTKEGSGKFSLLSSAKQLQDQSPVGV